MSYYTYILYSPDYDRFYIGETGDSEQRMYMHNEYEHDSYTYKYRPWDLKVYFEATKRSTAMRLEKYVKKKPGEYIKRIIDDVALQEYIKGRFRDSAGPVK
jgi:putative endonuclease